MSKSQDKRSKGTKNVQMYRSFVSKKMRELRDEQPGLDTREYMKMAANSWSDYKKKNGIVSEARKSSSVSRKSGSKSSKRAVNTSKSSNSKSSRDNRSKSRRLRDE